MLHHQTAIKIRYRPRHSTQIIVVDGERERETRQEAAAFSDKCRARLTFISPKFRSQINPSCSTEKFVPKEKEAPVSAFNDGVLHYRSVTFSWARFWNSLPPVCRCYDLMPWSRAWVRWFVAATAPGIQSKI